jgi:hypothetical protein
MEEILDQRKNWMYTSPRDQDRDKVIKEILGVRDYELDGLGKRKTAVERQFEGDKGRINKPDGARGNRPGLDGVATESAITRTGFDPTGRYGSTEEEDRAVIPELNPAYLFNSAIGDDPASSLNNSIWRSSILPPSISDPRFGPKTTTPSLPQVQQPQRDFQTLWDSQRTPFGRIEDPINDPIDATRSIMNPFAVKKPAPSVPTGVQGSASDPFAFPTSLPSASRSDFLSPSTFRGPASPGYTPPAAAPAPVLQPKPAVLEIPRPRF